MVPQDTNPSGVAEVCDEYLFGQVKTRESGSSEHEKTRKAPGVLEPAIVLPSPGV